MTAIRALNQRVYTAVGNLPDLPGRVPILGTITQGRSARETTVFGPSQGVVAHDLASNTRHRSGTVGFAHCAGVILSNI